MDVLRPTDEEGGVFTKRTLRKDGMVHWNNTGSPFFELLGETQASCVYRQKPYNHFTQFAVP